MFDPTDKPRVFAIPVGCDFSRNFVTGLQTRLAGFGPEKLGQTEIFVNTQRMARRLKELLIADGALLLPKIRVITNIASHPDLPITLPDPVSKLRRQLTLAQLVGGLLAADGSIAPQSAKFDLAQSLAAVMDEMQGEGVPLSALADISVDDQSGHWQRSLDFLNILAQHWDIETPTDPQDRQRAAALAFAAKWAETPPTHPILAIGSTASRGETALFMRAVAALPQGAVVLPGLDRALTDENWDALTRENVSVDNPQSALAGFCKQAGVALADIADWSDHPPANPARNALISLAMRPAPFTDQWLDEGPKLAPDLTDAITGWSLIEAETPKEEAMALALRLREAAEQGKRAVLITPDRTLTRRVTAVLHRWNILPDDSAGRPLHLTPPGIFLRLVANCMGQRLTPLDLIALLKHPLTDSGISAGDSRRFAREYEKKKLRGGAPFVDFDALRDWVDKDTKNPERRLWADWIERCFAPLETMAGGDLADMLALHLHTAESLAAGPSATAEHELWKLETGEKSAQVFKKLQADADAAGPLSVSDYRALFSNVLGGETAREARASHPTIAIWGTLEARVETADVVILGGLNDPIWPGVESPDPWLNRAMRKQIGLPPPERLIGLSAHDFQQGCGARELVLSHSVRDGDAPTVASRWIVRILNLMNGLGDSGKEAVKTLIANGYHWVQLARQMDRPAETLPAAPRPAPVPPADKRLKQLSVTQVERLIRDPYAVYAQKILHLKQLDPLGREPDALIRGIALHKVVEEFVTAYPDTLPEKARSALLRIAEEVLRNEVPWPAMQRIWLARLARIAGWFVEEETKRRKKGGSPKQEIKGLRAIENLDFELVAKADRIDTDAAGNFLIYDYKSGSPPTRPQTEFFNKQLQLEAAIAAVGGFEKIGRGTAVTLEYIGLSGSAQDTVGKTLDLEITPADIDQVWQEFVELVQSYQSDTKGFPARTRMQQMSYAYEFDHLSRKGEWEESDAPVDIPVGGDL
ncbi:double-strand break repair protein AddB [Roseobacter sp. N2S]|uniref:double-strand break repair protein AddB n=1 Tax=Roseobacter sp. N2S TaxID=2663844 RepID=UPI002855DC58|nr:double-strand break repair protein AddB [Roseobacter sp. N2S]MDR6263366.1 double-strand break repair protein AddB [Roseobacter sp. N2S]